MLQQNYPTAIQKMDHIAFRDILKKRQKKSLRQSLDNTNNVEISLSDLLPNHKQVSIESIIEKILKGSNKAAHKCQLSMEEKYAVIQHISDKESISYNRNTLIQLMTVWRFPATSYYQHRKHANLNEQSQEEDNIWSVDFFDNFFVLYGQVSIYENQQQEILPVRGQDCQPSTFETQSRPECLEDLVEGQQPKIILEQNSGRGPVFKRKEYSCNEILKVNNAIIIQVKPPQFEGMLVNLGGMDQDKKIKAIEYFPAFTKIGKKMLTFLPYIELKKYSKNQSVYKMKQKPQGVYLVLKGQIIFQVRIQLAPLKSRYNSNMKNVTDLILQTETLGVGNYFGEQEIIFKSNRNTNAICGSAECDLLEIPVDKFEKLLGYSDFLEEMKICAQVKIKKRKQKIDKSLQIHLQFSKSPEKYEENPSPSPIVKSQTCELNKIVRKRSTQPVRMMHGNVIRKVPASMQSQPVNFSMLAANPDMYEATLKKFRRYSIKQTEKYKPQVNWNLKRVWKVLNLQTILREDAEINSPEGRKFYETHRRLQNHVQQNKSLRPKTSSSNYRTKLQYIAYLQQFNN